MVQVKRKRNEDGLILPPPPPPSSSSSEVVDSDVHGSTMMEDGIRSEKGSDSNDAVEEANRSLSGCLISEVSETENQILEEERNCCLNRSPSYSSFSIDDDEVEIIDDDGIAEDKGKTRAARSRELEDLTLASQIRTILKIKYRPQLVMAVAISFFQQVTGINVISFYAPLLFRTIGMEESASPMSSVSIGTIRI
ncbi:Hexose carrier protein HEX6 [Linum perenne]